MDNATNTNKNCYLFPWAMEQVKRVFLVQSTCFLVAGHTKITPDRLFASSSKSYNVSDIFNIMELKDVHAKHCSGEGDKMMFRVGDKCYDPQIYVK